MKSVVILFGALLLFSFSFQAKSSFEKGIKPKIERKNGMLNGSYTSYYSNGAKKAEGTYTNNLKTGTWTYFDSLGNEKLTYNFLSNGKTKELKRNEQNQYTFHPLKQADIEISKRCWREISSSESNNLLFFKDNLLIKTMLSAVLTKQSKAFSGDNDEFKKQLTFLEIEQLAADKNWKVVGYRIKEDWFYNTTTGTGETRVIGICPMVQRKDSKEANPLCWFFYPDVRNALSKTNVSSNQSPLIQNLDDLFYFRQFASDLYKVSNVKNLKIATKEEAENEELILLELEDDAVLGIVKK